MTPSDEKFSKLILDKVSVSIRHFIPSDFSDNELKIVVLCISATRNMAIYELMYPGETPMLEDCLTTIDAIIAHWTKLGKNLAPPVNYTPTQMVILRLCLDEAYRVAKLSNRAEIATQLRQTTKRSDVKTYYAKELSHIRA